MMQTKIKINTFFNLTSNLIKSCRSTELCEFHKNFRIKNDRLATTKFQQSQSQIVMPNQKKHNPGKIKRNKPRKSPLYLHIELKVEIKTQK